MISTNDVLQWLLENGGPVIRYRTAAELMPKGCADENRLKKDLLEDPTVQAWLNNLDPQNVNRRTYHGSFDTCFENAMGMLIQLGLRAGTPALDEKTQPLRDWLSSMVMSNPAQWDVFAMTVFAAFFALAGYEDEAVQSFLRLRLDTLYGFTSLGGYDLYDDPGKYKGIPTAFLKKPIIKPCLYDGGNHKYPLIYDVYGLSSMVGKGGKEADERIATVIRYILTPEYHQKVADGYGIVVSPNGRYYSMGWDVKLPGFFLIPKDMGAKGPLLLHRMDLMANFPCAAAHEWFKGAIRHLEGFQTTRGTYLFPRHYLREMKGYWVQGMHMALGENRRAKISLELESTFLMLLIKKRAGILP